MYSVSGPISTRGQPHSRALPKQPLARKNPGLIDQEATITEIRSIGRQLLESFEFAEPKSSVSRSPLVREEAVQATDFSFTIQEDPNGSNPSIPQTNYSVVLEPASRKPFDIKSGAHLQQYTSQATARPEKATPVKNKLYEHVRSKVYITQKPTLSVGPKVDATFKTAEQSLAQTKMIKKGNASVPVSVVNSGVKPKQRVSTLEQQQDIYFRSIEKLKIRERKLEEERSKREALVQLCSFHPKINSNVTLDGSFEERLNSSTEKSKVKRARLMEQQLQRIRDSKIHKVDLSSLSSSKIRHTSTVPRQQTREKRSVTPTLIPCQDNKHSIDESQIARKRERVIEISSVEELSFLLE